MSTKAADNAVSSLKRAVTAKDPVLMGKAVDALRKVGYNYKDCYRVALAADPSLTLGEWDDYMAQADDAASKG